MKKIMLWLFFVILLTGCANYSSVTLKPLENNRSDNTATIVVFQKTLKAFGNSNAMTREGYLLLNKIPVAAMRNGVYVELIVEPGTHEITHKYADDFRFIVEYSWWEEKSIKVNVNQAETKYIFVNRLSHNQYTISQSNEETAAIHMKTGSKYELPKEEETIHTR